jgi:hypothetical protein
MDVESSQGTERDRDRESVGKGKKDKEGKGKKKEREHCRDRQPSLAPLFDPCELELSGLVTLVTV